MFACDFTGDDAAQWPRFAPAAVEAGFRALMSTQLTTTGGPRAALNLYSHEADAFDDDARTLWRRALERLGGRYAMVARMPDDPATN